MTRRIAWIRHSFHFIPTHIVAFVAPAAHKRAANQVGSLANKAFPMSSMPFSKYPRDLAGYGRSPPDPRWPGKARVAVQFVVNFEEGTENSILHGDAASEAFLTEVLGT